MTTSANPQPASHHSLILGGVKSGKSRHAEHLAQAHTNTCGSGITLIATATANDDEMARRIARHQASRDQSWRVIEEPLLLAAALRHAESTTQAVDTTACIVIDCLTLWITNLLMHESKTMLEVQVAEFLSAAEKCPARLIVVSNETNLGVTPMGALSRRFCDETGLLHQALGSMFDQVTLMVAGIAMNVKG